MRKQFAKLQNQIEDFKERIKEMEERRVGLEKNIQELKITIEKY